MQMRQIIVRDKPMLLHIIVSYVPIQFDAVLRDLRLCIALHKERCANGNSTQMSCCAFVPSVSLDPRIRANEAAQLVGYIAYGLRYTQDPSRVAATSVAGL